MSTRPLTVQELADRWSVTRESVYALIKQGRLRAFRLGGKLYRVSFAEVERWESAGESTPTDHTGLGSSTVKLSVFGESGEHATASGLPPPQKARGEALLIRMSKIEPA